MVPMEEHAVTANRATEPMGAVDRAWLEMDELGNPMVVSAVLELREVGDLEALVRHILGVLLKYRRFRQRIDDSHTPPVWREDDDLLLSYHVRIFHLSEDSPEHDVAHAVARELSHPLDRALPLWRLTLFVRAQGEVTVLFRAHHALADGIALVRVLMSCTDGWHHATYGLQHQRRDLIESLVTRVEATTARLRRIGRLLFDPLQRREFVTTQMRAGRETLSAIARVLALPEDHPPSLRKELSGQRAVAWTDGFAFAPLRARARALGVKINDLFLAGLAGAFGRYLLDTEGRLAPGQNLRISIPVNLRAKDDGELGNCFGLVLLDLPVGERNWRTRLHIVSARMLALKSSPEARAMLIGLAAAGHMPVAWEKSLVGLLASKSAAVVSNLPGPHETLRIGGARLSNLVFWPPQAGGIGIGISLFSYGGRVTMGVSADTAVMREPQRLVAAFEEEMALMLHPRKRARKQVQPQPVAEAPVRECSLRPPQPAIQVSAASATTH